MRLLCIYFYLLGPVHSIWCCFLCVFVFFGACVPHQIAHSMCILIFLVLLCHIQQHILHICSLYGPSMPHGTVPSAGICNLWHLHVTKDSTFHAYFDFLATMRCIKQHILCVFILYSAACRIQQHPLHVIMCFSKGVLH